MKLGRQALLDVLAQGMDLRKHIQCTVFDALAANHCAQAVQRLELGLKTLHQLGFMG